MRRSGALVLATVLLVGLPVGSAGQEQSADPLPGPGSQLAPGRYMSSLVGPSIEFRLEDGWLVGGAPQDGPIFTLERTDPPGQVLTVTRFDGEAFADSCDPTSLTQVEPGVERLMEIIAGNPSLRAAPARPTEVDGFRGLSLDVAVPAVEDCDLPFLLLWALPMEDGEFVQVPLQQSRFIALDVEGEIVVIAIESFPGVPFGGLLEASMELVESMRIAPDASAGEIPVDPSPTIPSPLPVETPGSDPSPSPEPPSIAATS